MTPKAVYREGAKQGVYMGFYLITMFFMVILSEKASIVSILAFLSIILVPLFAYKLMVNVHKRYSCSADFPSLWMLGILIFIGGSMICALVTYAYLQYVDYEFISRQAESAIEVYKNMPDTQISEMVSVMQMAVDKGILPSPIEFSMEMLWVTAFFGSVLSMILSAVIRKRYPKQI